MKSRFLKGSLLLLVVLVVGLLVLENVDRVSAFDLSKSSIPKEDILSGGPSKDGIPAILSPKFIKPDEASSFLNDSDRVIGLKMGREARAYPIKILNWHEVVNDRIGNRKILITYCPLCGTGIVFDSRLKGKDYTFGVSGLLYQSDLLFYDHQTESLWSQIDMEAVTGKLIGTKLKQLPVLHTSWGAWKRKHPGTLVLSTDTGYSRDYHRDPYRGYEKQAWLMFPTKKSDARYHTKEWVMGVKINEVAKAYPFSELRKSPETFSDNVGGKSVNVHFDSESSTASLTDAKGNPIGTVVGFWFAWYAFNSDTLVYSAE